jgi:hypothetical protein
VDDANRVCHQINCFHVKLDYLEEVLDPPENRRHRATQEFTEKPFRHIRTFNRDGSKTENNMDSLCLFTLANLPSYRYLHNPSSMGSAIERPYAGWIQRSKNKIVLADLEEPSPVWISIDFEDPEGLTGAVSTAMLSRGTITEYGSSTTGKSRPFVFCLTERCW